MLFDTTVNQAVFIWTSLNRNSQSINNQAVNKLLANRCFTDVSWSSKLWDNIMFCMLRVIKTPEQCSVHTLSLHDVCLWVLVWQSASVGDVIWKQFTFDASWLTLGPSVCRSACSSHRGGLSLSWVTVRVFLLIHSSQTGSDTQSVDLHCCSSSWRQTANQRAPPSGWFLTCCRLRNSVHTFVKAL